MSKTQQMIKSFYHFKMLSAFRILPMGKAISYLFYLSLVVLLPVLASAFFTYWLSNETPSALNNVSSGVFVVIFLPFIYFLIAAVLFIVVSLFAFIAMGAVKWRKKRADYKQLWNIAAFSITAPTIVFVLIESFLWSHSILLYLFVISSIIYTALALRYLPKKN
ncbi:DUF1189 family protein [Halobacillus sp. Marseille-Q1614]|uniref:DUF1189 family protein n=1 Tax=Halobacillus sp. Marseille-Q1614 TaxID=2709134 RepID=UPI00156E7DEE|nr:DUF1189 family protein [Halobacillus sp. Marseille-Q1614]